MKEKNKNQKISVWVPYSDLLQKQLPHNKGTDVRFVKRIFSLLNLVRVVVKLKLRKLFVLEGETSVIADFEDFKEVLSMIQNFEGLPKFKLDFLKDVFIPCYESKDSPDVQNEGGKAEKREEIIAVTTRELCEFYKDKNGKSINTDNLKRTFLNQLINEGLIDYTVSQIHGKQYIYYPLVTESLSILSIMTQRDEHSQQSKGIYEKITENITADWISSKIMQLIRYRIGQGYNMENLIDYLNNEKQFLIMDDEGNSRISLQKFVKIYPPTLSQSMTIRAQFLPFLPKRAISCRFWAKSMSEMSPLLPPAPSSPAYKCNYCEAKFDTIEGHEEQFEYNHEGLLPRPHKGEIEEMQANGIEEVDFKGNALE